MSDESGGRDGSHQCTQKHSWTSLTILRQPSFVYRAIRLSSSKPDPVVYSPPRSPFLQFIIIVTPTREVPPRNTPQVRRLGLEARVRGAHQALAEVVEAVSHVWSLGVVCRCVLTADGKIVCSSDRVLSFVSVFFGLWRSRGFLADQAVRLMHSGDGTDFGAVGWVADESLTFCT